MRTDSARWARSQHNVCAQGRLLIAVVLAVLLGSAKGEAHPDEALRVLFRSSISPPGGQWHNWVIIDANAKNPQQLITCGSRWSPAENRLSGFLYGSFDSGRSWQLKVTDESTAWVSEESCAFSPDGHAYFVADASAVVDGMTHHALGTTRIYSSIDAGQHWSAPSALHLWTDHNAIAITAGGDSIPATLHVVYNAFPNSNSDASPISENSATVLGTRLSRPGQRLSKARPRVILTGVVGKPPIAVRLLVDGSALVLYGMPEIMGSPYAVSILKVGPDGQPSWPLFPVMTVRPAANCLSYPAMGIANGSGEHRGRVYVAAVDATTDGCEILLSKSDDDGETWSPAAIVHQPERRTIPAQADGDFTFTMAVNNVGVVGLAWSDDGHGCWQFSASTDGGRTFPTGIPLSPCVTDRQKDLRVGNHYLEAYPGDDREGEKATSSYEPAFSVRGGVGYTWRTTMTASSDGLFHPAWIEFGDDGGQIWTAAVSVGEPPAAQLFLSTADLIDVSPQVTFQFANTHYDVQSGLLSIDIGVINRARARARLRVPLLMEVTDLHSDLGQVEAENADNGRNGTGAVWDLSHLLRDGSLAPGAASERRQLLFRITNPHPPSGREQDLVIVKAKMLSASTLPTCGIDSVAEQQQCAKRVEH
jgi:hypothetical protein